MTQTQKFGLGSGIAHSTSINQHEILLTFWLYRGFSAYWRFMSRALTWIHTSRTRIELKSHLESVNFNTDLIPLSIFYKQRLDHTAKVLILCSKKKILGVESREITACKIEQIQKMTPFFTQGPFWAKIVVILWICSV